MWCRDICSFENAISVSRDFQAVCIDIPSSSAMHVAGYNIEIPNVRDLR